MAKQKERTTLQKTNWTQSFTLVGKPKFTEYTYTIDKRSEKSDWIYNSLNLGIDCGSKSGTVYCEMMGGYGSERTNNVIYVHGKNEDGTDDFKNSFTIAWEDRFEESILEEIGDMCFLRVGLEVDTKGQTVTKKFLSQYDAIAYIKDVLTEDMVVNVRGQLRYSMYNGNLRCRKEINSIYLSKAEPENFRATFIQTMLIDRDCIGRDSMDKDKNVLYVDAYLLEKFKEFNGWDLTEDGKVKGGIFVPLRKRFEYDLNGKSQEATTLTISKIFKVKKGVSQVTFEGDFIESGATVKATEADLSEDIKMCIAMGMYTLEQALALCADNGSKERRMVLSKIHLKKVGDDDNKTLAMQYTPEVYTEDDLLLDCLVPKETNDEDDELPFGNDEDTSSQEEDDLAALLANM